ncbi:hypothetical protein ACFL0C_01390 [Patescibacteria group bacterium]
MKKLDVKIILITLSLVIVLFVTLSTVLLNKERVSKLASLNREIEQQNQIKADLKKYREDYIVFITEEKEINRQQMLETKMAYEYLLQEQDKIIAEHARQVAVTDTAPTTSQNTTNTTSPTTKTVKRTVSKPTATRSTKAS